MKKLIITSLLFFTSTILLAGGHVGNGGDIRRFRARSAFEELKYVLNTFNKNVRNPKNNIHLKSVSSKLVNNSAALAEWANHMSMFDDENNSTECLTATSGVSKYIPIIFNLNYSHCEKKQPQEFYLSQMGFLFLNEILKINESNFDLFNQIIQFNLKCNSKPFHSKISNLTSYDLSQVKTDTEFMKYVEDGRTLALKLITNFNPHLLPETKGIDLNGDNTKKSILIRAKELLPLEMEKSIFKINIENSDSCGLTDLKSLSPVYFSISECSGIINNYEMAWVLIHEMVHHTGVSSENYADFVASAIVGDLNRTR